MTRPLRDVTITIPGTPVPKGSMKCIGRGGRHQLVEDNPRTTPWRRRIASLVRSRVTSEAAPRQPLAVDLLFTVPRPKSVRAAHPVTRSAGDLDKLVRLALDALQDTALLPDDAQVVELHAWKAYEAAGMGMPYPGLRVRLYDPEEP